MLASQCSQMFYLKNSSLPSNWYAVQMVTTRSFFNLPQPPLTEDGGSDFNGVDAYQEDNSSDAYIRVQFNANDMVNPMHRPGVEPIQIDASTTIAHG